jgi:hypothetical protein
MALLLVTVGAIGRAAASPAVIPAAVLDTVCIPIDIFGVDGNVDTLGFDMKACACGTTLAIAPASSPFCGTTAIADGNQHFQVHIPISVCENCNIVTLRLCPATIFGMEQGRPFHGPSTCVCVLCDGDYTFRAVASPVPFIPATVVSPMKFTAGDPIGVNVVPAAPGGVPELNTGKGAWVALAALGGMALVALDRRRRI